MDLPKWFYRSKERGANNTQFFIKANLRDSAGNPKSFRANYGNRRTEAEAVDVIKKRFEEHEKNLQKKGSE